MTAGRSSPLAGRTIVLGVTGSIAVVKAPALVTGLVARGARVQVALSAAAREFVLAATFAPLTPCPILTERDQAADLAALDPAADSLLVAPASARSIADLATGGAGLLPEIARRVAGPIAIAPAMESKMYGHPATQRHIRALTEQGARFIGPAAGRLASGATGRGRLVEPADLIDELEGFLAEV